MSKAQQGQRKVTTVWLDAETEGVGDKTTLFFCFNCRIPLIEYEGNVLTIVPGKSPYSPNTTQKCKGTVKLRNGEWEECGMYYSFQGAIYTENPTES